MILSTELYDQYSYDELREKLVMESASSSINAETILGLFSELIPKASGVISNITATLTNSVRVDSEVKELGLVTKQYKEVLTLTKNIPFMSFADTVVLVPEGFKGDLATYSKVLAALRHTVIQDAMEVMRDYEIQLSIFLNNADSRKSLEKYDFNYKKVEAKRKDIETSIMRYFASSGVKSRLKLGQVVSRYADLTDIFKNAETLSGYKTKQDLEKLVNSSATITGILKLIKGKMEKNEIDVISGQAAKNISEGSYQVAKYLEIVSLVMFNVEVYLGCVNVMSDQLYKALKA